MYGRQTDTALAALSRLAEAWDGGATRLSASDIADSRNLHRPAVAKVLCALSQAGLVSGAPGPGGGYALTRDPRSVTVHEALCLFQHGMPDSLCSLGDWARGTVLQRKLARVEASVERVLRETTLQELGRKKGDGATKRRSNGGR